jgi:predicted RNA-binding Zn-ribbon protein involved in translation (DUF1610 family)
MNTDEIKCLNCGWMLGRITKSDTGSYFICPVCGAIVHYKGVNP